MITVAIVKEVNETELVATWTPSDIAVKVGDWIGVECKEQPAQEPVAWISESTLKHSVEYRNRFDDAKSWTEIRAVDRKTTNCDVPLYTHPAPSWQGLSDDEIWDIANFLGKNKEWDYPVMFAKTIERALKEKNND